MAKIQRRPKILPTEAQICRLPVRDRTVGLLFMSIGVGPMEPKAGGVRGVGLRAGNYSGWYPVALPLRRELAGDINHRGGEGYRKIRDDSRTRGSYQSEHHPKEPVGPKEPAGPAVPQSDTRRRRHVAGASSPVREAG